MTHFAEGFISIFLVFFLFLMGLYFLFGDHGKAEPQVTPYGMHCINVQNPNNKKLVRCENKEVVCYETTSGFSCLKKNDHNDLVS